MEGPGRGGLGFSLPLPSPGHTGRPVARHWHWKSHLKHRAGLCISSWHDSRWWEGRPALERGQGRARGHVIWHGSVGADSGLLTGLPCLKPPQCDLSPEPRGSARLPRRSDTWRHSSVPSLPGAGCAMPSAVLRDSRWPAGWSSQRVSGKQSSGTARQDVHSPSSLRVLQARRCGTNWSEPSLRRESRAWSHLGCLSALGSQLGEHGIHLPEPLPGPLRRAYRLREGGPWYWQ